MSSRDTKPSEVLAFWQARTSETLSEEDARGIMETLYELYTILHGWYLEDHPDLSNPAGHPHAG